MKVDVSATLTASATPIKPAVKYSINRLRASEGKNQKKRRQKRQRESKKEGKSSLLNGEVW
jgi:hypothetical protein